MLRAFLIFAVFFSSAPFLYAWTPRDKAWADSRCSEAADLNRKAGKDKEDSDTKKQSAQSFKEKADTALYKLNPLMEEYKQMETYVFEYEPEVSKQLDFIEKVGTFLKTHTSMQGVDATTGLEVGLPTWNHDPPNSQPWKTKFYQPVFDWVNCAKSCISPGSFCGGLCASKIQQGPYTVAPAPMVKAGAPPGQQPIPKAECPKGNGAPQCTYDMVCIDLLKTVIENISGCYSQMKVKKPLIIAARTDYQTNLTKSDQFFKASANLLSSAKNKAEQAKEKMRASDGRMGKSNYCQERVKDYSAEAARLKEETEKLLNVAKGLGKSK